MQIQTTVGINRNVPPLHTTDLFPLYCWN